MTRSSLRWLSRISVSAVGAFLAGLSISSMQGFIGLVILAAIASAWAAS